MLRKIFVTLPSAVFLALLGLLTFATVGHAATAVETSTDFSLVDLITPVYNAFKSGHFELMAALLVILVAALFKRYLGDKIAFLHTDAGGAILAFFAATATAAAAGLSTVGFPSLTFGLLKTSLMVGVTAAGGFAILRHLLVDPILKPLMAKAPAWAQPIFTMVLWIFDHEGTTASILASATKAGNDAVNAHIVGGTGGILGPSGDLP